MPSFFFQLGGWAWALVYGGNLSLGFWCLSVLLAVLLGIRVLTREKGSTLFLKLRFSQVGVMQPDLCGGALYVVNYPSIPT